MNAMAYYFVHESSYIDDGVSIGRGREIGDVPIVLYGCVTGRSGIVCRRDGGFDTYFAGWHLQLA
ncbi:MAG: hypothetical protein GX796_04215 [Clostridiaceae bacterium]|nr:hypothetical protein [Clostridiaceae bacterium]